MKKILLAVIFSIVLLATVLFYPHRVEQGVIADATNNSMSIYIDGALKNFKIDSPIAPKFAVIHFKYNFFKAYSIEVISPITERVMIKGQNGLDLEASGVVPLATQSFYYEITKTNTLKPVTGQKLLVGKNNVKCYKNNDGKIQTVLILPTEYTSTRVGISTTSFFSLFHSKVELLAPSDTTLYSVKDKFSLPLPKDTSIIIEKSNEDLKVTFNNTTQIFKDRVYLKGEGIAIKSILRGNPSFIPVYSGVLEFTVLNSQIVIINEVNLEDYLKKVIPSEMPTTGGIEALKAQAIAARTYALSDMLLNRYAYLGFYVDDSTQSQVYNNSPEKVLSNEAVQDTKGLILTFAGAPVDAKYYSTSAGTGASYSDIWFKSDGTSENKPYLKNNNFLIPKTPLPTTEEDWLKFYKNKTLTALDGNVPYFRWQVELQNASITKSLNASLKTIFQAQKEFISIKKQGILTVNEPMEFKNLKDIKVVKRGESGNIMELSLVFENATINLKSDYTIRSALKCSSEYTGVTTKITRLTGDPVLNNTFLPSAFFSFESGNGKYTIYGGGYGHGVGMSQNAAMTLSSQGKDYKEILNTFYKDVKIESIP